MSASVMKKRDRNTGAGAGGSRYVADDQVVIARSEFSLLVHNYLNRKGDLRENHPVTRLKDHKHTEGESLMSTSAIQKKKTKNRKEVCCDDGLKYVLISDSEMIMEKDEFFGLVQNYLNLQAGLDENHPIKRLKDYIHKECEEMEEQFYILSGYLKALNSIGSHLKDDKYADINHFAGFEEINIHMEEGFEKLQKNLGKFKAIIHETTPDFTNLEPQQNPKEI